MRKRKPKKLDRKDRKKKEHIIIGSVCVDILKV